MSTSSERFNTILIFGAPGSGKGTQGNVLGEIPRFYHFAMGDAFRSLDTRSEIGQEFLDYSSRGELVPDELTIKFFKQQIDYRVDAGAFKPDIDFLILDGIPRNTKQAELLEPYINVVGLFHLSCPDRDELGRRLRKRALKEGRLDDAAPVVIQHRIQTYENETKPLLEYYNEVVVEVHAAQPPIKVLSDLLDSIMKLEAWSQWHADLVV